MEKVENSKFRYSWSIQSKYNLDGLQTISYLTVLSRKKAASRSFQLAKSLTFLVACYWWATQAVSCSLRPLSVNIMFHLSILVSTVLHFVVNTRRDSHTDRKRRVGAFLEMEKPRREKCGLNTPLNLFHGPLPEQSFMSRRHARYDCGFDSMIRALLRVCFLGRERALRSTNTHMHFFMKHLRRVLCQISHSINIKMSRSESC